MMRHCRSCSMQRHIDEFQTYINGPYRMKTRICIACKEKPKPPTREEVLAKIPNPFLKQQTNIQDLSFFLSGDTI
jgi:uncharacterized protein with PIN domain